MAQYLLAHTMHPAPQNLNPLLFGGRPKCEAGDLVVRCDVESPLCARVATDRISMHLPSAEQNSAN